jgi:hypothetical protein
MHGSDRVAHGVTDLGDLETGVSRVAATVVKEVANVMGLEYFNQALIFTLVIFQAFQFEAAGAKSA